MESFLTYVYDRPFLCYGVGGYLSVFIGHLISVISFEVLFSIPGLLDPYLLCYGNKPSNGNQKKSENGGGGGGAEEKKSDSVEHFVSTNNDNDKKTIITTSARATMIQTEMAMKKRQGSSSLSSSSDNNNARRLGVRIVRQVIAAHKQWFIALLTTGGPINLISIMVTTCVMMYCKGTPTMMPLKPMETIQQSDIYTMLMGKINVGGDERSIPSIPGSSNNATSGASDFTSPASVHFGHMLPTIPEFILCFVAMMFVADFMLYWGHRLQHEVEIFWYYFHSLHHELLTPTAISTVYIDGTDAALQAGIPMLTAAFVVQPHPIVMWSYLFFHICNNVLNHTGLHKCWWLDAMTLKWLPFRSKNSFHDSHHRYGYTYFYEDNKNDDANSSVAASSPSSPSENVVGCFGPRKAGEERIHPLRPLVELNKETGERVGTHNASKVSYDALHGLTKVSPSQPKSFLGKLFRSRRNNAVKNFGEMFWIWDYMFGTYGNTVDAVGWTPNTLKATSTSPQKTTKGSKKQE